MKSVSMQARNEGYGIINEDFGIRVWHEATAVKCTSGAHEPESHTIRRSLRSRAQRIISIPKARLTPIQLRSRDRKCVSKQSSRRFRYVILHEDTAVKCTSGANGSESQNFLHNRTCPRQIPNGNLRMRRFVLKEVRGSNPALLQRRVFDFWRAFGTHLVHISTFGKFSLVVWRGSRVMIQDARRRVAQLISHIKSSFPKVNSPTKPSTHSSLFLIIELG